MQTCPVNWEAVEAVGVWFGVVIAGAALVAAWLSLRDVASQARSASMQAAAANRQVEAILNSDRAWIDGGLNRYVNLVIRYALSVTNHGRTPARLARYIVRHGFLQRGVPFAPELLANSRVVTKQVFVGSGKTEELEDLNVDDFFRDPPLVEGRALNGVIHVDVFYADIITGVENRRTSFMYLYHPLTSHIERIAAENRYE